MKFENYGVRLKTFKSHQSIKALKLTRFQYPEN